jgi:hypothetical protein
MTSIDILSAYPASHYVYNLNMYFMWATCSNSFCWKEKIRDSCLPNVPYFSSAYLRFMINDPQPLSVCKQSMSALYDMHCFNLDNKIGILGRLHLFGCIPVLAKQRYFTVCCKIPRIGYIWLFITISCPWDQGIYVHVQFSFHFSLYLCACTEAHRSVS